MSGPAPDVWPSDPCAFALQDRFRQAAVAGDIEALRSLLQAHGTLLAAGDRMAGLQIISWGEARLDTADFALLQSAFQDDIGLTADLLPPDAQAGAALQRAIPDLLDRLGTVLPAWAQEFRAMVRWVVLAQSSQGGFAGASAFAAWGAILVNPAVQNDALTLAMTLIHESSHLKLFSAYLDDEIVLNDPDETYASPLRIERRPMNGLYHAAFVLARMACFLDDLRQSGRAEAVLGVAQSGLEVALQAAVSDFGEAYDVIRSHGNLTETGHAIIAAAATATQAIRG
ncbi:aKG-HExxH-type peptide beta-hydroxylase [Cypionkella sinensis]|uniref:aKG-HExxH-type peptide beta-hydroxylase n=1 Tax=Cypionkella sinensis TaxID=1756043 RepID=UPI00362C4812